MARKYHLDGTCSVCGKIGPTHEDLESDVPDLPALCDRCNYAQRRWEDWQYHLAHLGAGYPHWDGPPKSPPVRR